MSEYKKISEDHELGELNKTATLERQDTHREPDPPDRDRWGNHCEFLLASIGLAVGTGNVWRFPYLAQQNGGGAFLIPYFIMLLVEGLPLFYLELALGQRMQKGSIRIWQDIREYFKGIGIGQLLVSFQMTAYFPMVMCWCMYYFYLSFSNPLPWTLCNTVNGTLADACCKKDKASWLWWEETLQATSSIADTGGFVPAVTGCWFVGWVLTYLCLFKGIKSSGKAAYFTATFPYVVLVGLFIRAILLPGAWNGISVLLKPQWSRLGDPQVWLDAAGQIFYSLSVGFGALILFGSYNNVKNNCSRDAAIISFVNCGTSVFASFVVYSVLGYREVKLGIPVQEVASGPGLAFIAYPTAVAAMPLPQLWSAAFFIMMVLLAIDSEFGTIEACIGPLRDYHPFNKIRKEVLCLVVCSVLCLLGLPMCTRGGIYVFRLYDTFSVPIPLLFIGIAQCVVVSWFYGLDKFCEDIEYMTGSQPHFYWKICWKYISPGAITIILISNLVLQCLSPAKYSAYVGCTNASAPASTWTQDLQYPWWGELVAAVMVMCPVVPMPLCAAMYFVKKHFKRKEEPGAIEL